MIEVPDHQTIIDGRMFPSCGGNYLGTVVEPPEPEENALRYHWIQAGIAAHAVYYTAITSDSTEILEFRRPKNPDTAPDAPRLRDIYAYPPQGDKPARPRVVKEIMDGMDDKQNSLGTPDEVRFFLIPPDQATLDL